MLPRSSAEFYRSQQRLGVLTVAAARRAWSGMGADFDRSWAVVGPRLVVLSSAAQLGAARAGAAYVPRVLAETGQDDQPDAEVNPRGFVGVAADGRSLDGLLYGAVTEAKTAVGNGAPPDVALAQGGRWLDMAAQTLVADAGRGATGLGIFTRNTGYVRMLNPPSCSRCAVLAGKWFRTNQGFQRHPRCFPAGVVVSGPAVDAATRRQYEGEVVVLTTASGQELPVTGNHPVLTGRGWIPANLIQEGDDVVRSTRPQGAAALVVPDHDQVPARIEDVWAALGMAGLDTVESSPEDFHGDGQHGQVDVVRADRPLNDRIFSVLLEEFTQDHLTPTPRASGALDSQRPAHGFDLGQTSHPCSPVGLGGLGGPLNFGQVRVSDLAGVAHAASWDSRLSQNPGDRPARYPVLAGQTVLAGPGRVRPDDLLSGQGETRPRWDAPGDSFTVETSAGYTARGRDLLKRLTGQVELDRVVEVRRVQWAGHVYSLSSSEGWHSANSLIVSNCDCVHIPSSEDVAGDFLTDPAAAARSGQITDLTAAQQRAIEDGADLSQLVNARRGTSGLGGLTTTEGTTRRGLAGQRLAGRTRLSPEGIYARAGNDRAEALRLLKQHGYVI